MNPTREALLFQLALSKPAAKRAAWLDAECEGDAALRQRLDALLAAHGQPARLPDSLAGADDPTLKLKQAAGPRDETVGQTLGRYKLLERVGEGGCGVVYVAEQTQPVRRRVALKVIKLGMDTREVIVRFEAERQALAMMDHPNIARVLDAGTTELGRPYFVMELVRGIPITDYCDQANLDTKARLDLFIKVCQAIQHAHQKGIIHRDIKPSNILVTLHDGVPVPKVIDFGIAKATEGRLTDNTVYTQLHQFIGTPAYMSPEQAEMSGLDIDTRTDIYALGVLLYELLAGSTPFDAKELMESGIDAMRKTIREMEPVRPSTRLAMLKGEELTATARRRSADTSKLMHQLKGDLDWIVMKCLEKDRQRRYDTANGLAADIKRHLNNEPVVARPPSAAYKFQKAIRRNKVVFSAGLAVGLALLAGLGISLWQYAGKSRAEREQVQLRERAEVKAREASEARAIAAQQRDLAQENLYESLLREARSIRKTRQVGYRSEVFTRLKQAIAAGTTNTDTSMLRREAAASFGDWVGLDPVDIVVPSGVWFAALTPDGTLAALALTDSRLVSLRETRTGREVAAIDVGGEAISLAFDSKGFALWVVASESKIQFNLRPKPLRLEKWLARGDGSWRREWSRPADGVIKVVSVADAVIGLTLGPDDSYVALQNLEANEETARVPVSNPLSWLPGIDISSDQQQLAFFSSEETNSFDWQLEVWDLAARKRAALLKSRLGPGYGLSFGPNGRTLAATYGNTLIVHETSQFSRTLSTVGSFESTLGATIGGPSGLLAVPLDQELAVRLIKLQSGRELAVLRTPGLSRGQFFSRDGSALVMTHSLGSRIVHLQAEREKLRLEGHVGGVPGVEFSPDGKQLASVGKDRTLRLWDLTTPGESRVVGQLPAPGQTLAYTPDGAFLVCGYYNVNELSIWSTQSGMQVGRVNESPDHSGTTWACAISPDGKHLAAVGTGLRVWNFAELIRPTPGGTGPLLFSEANGLSGVVFDPLSQRVAFQDVVTKEPFVATAIRTRELAPDSVSMLVATNAHENFVQGIGFLPKSSALGYVSQSREITLLEPTTGRVIRSFPTRAPGDTTQSSVKNLRASPDESRLAMASVSGLEVELWNPATGKLIYSLPEEPGTIWWLAWSPDSQRLAVARANGDIAIWNLHEIEAQLAQIGLKP